MMNRLSAYVFVFVLFVLSGSTAHAGRVYRGLRLSPTLTIWNTDSFVNEDLKEVSDLGGPGIRGDLSEGMHDPWAMEMSISFLKPQQDESMTIVPIAAGILGRLWIGDHLALTGGAGAMFVAVSDSDSADGGGGGFYAKLGAELGWPAVSLFGEYQLNGASVKTKMLKSSSGNMTPGPKTETLSLEGTSINLGLKFGF